MTKKKPYVGKKDADGFAQGSNGPSWFEVCQFCTEFEATLSLRVGFTVHPAHALRRYEAGALWVRASCYDPDTKRSDVVVGGAQFKGNSGTKTFPAAMYAALLDVWEKAENWRDGYEQSEMDLEAPS